MLPFITQETLLEVKGINKSYDRPILRDIHMEIRNIVRPDMQQGQIVSLVGRSGCGKSTLFRIMGGLEAPDSGTVLRFDKSGLDLPDTMEPVQEGDMGVVFQTSYIYPWRKVKSILRMAASKNMTADFDSDIAIEHYVELLSLRDHLNKYANQLSGGQRQRVAIAEQILNGGDFILMDEPFSGLDTLTIDKVANMLTTVAKDDERKTIILISHDLSNSLAISDTAYILSEAEPGMGSTITHRIDLATQGLAWQPDIKENLLFRDLLKQVKSLL